MLNRSWSWTMSTHTLAAYRLLADTLSKTLMNGWVVCSIRVSRWQMVRARGQEKRMSNVFPCEIHLMLNLMCGLTQQNRKRPTDCIRALIGSSTNPCFPLSRTIMETGSGTWGEEGERKVVTIMEWVYQCLPIQLVESHIDTHSTW